MSIKTILIVLGEPNSTFSEVLLKYFNSKFSKRNKSRIILIGNKKLFYKQMRKLKYNFSLNEINAIKEYSANFINIINIDYKFKNTFSRITVNSADYIEKCFDLSLKIIGKKKTQFLINGPVSKKHFLKKKFPGITEYVASKTNSTEPVMLIYNKELSVSPLTTHIPIKSVFKNVKKKKIINNIIKIDKFYKLKLKKRPYIAVLGLNPHCETISKISEEKKEIIPAINYLTKKGFKVSGPFSADTFFLEKNIKKFDVVLGMYHDQVLAPVKTLYKFEAINITLGLPFLKITPDHGPNYQMVGKNRSDPSSIFYALNFMDKI